MSSETDSDIKLAHECLCEFEAASYSPRAISLVSCLFNLASDDQKIICRNHADTCLRIIRQEVERALHNMHAVSEDQIEHWIVILNTIKKETSFDLPEEWDHRLSRLEVALERKLDTNNEIGALAEITGVGRPKAFHGLRTYSLRNREFILGSSLVRRKRREIERRESEIFCPVAPVIEAAARVTGQSVGAVQKEWPRLTPEQRGKIATNPRVKAMLNEMDGSRKGDVNLDDLLPEEEREDQSN